MTRNRNRKKGTKGLGARVEVVSGRSNINYAANSANVLNISPASFSRCLVMADVFQFYRFTKLRCIAPPNGGTASTVGYAPGAAFDTPPTTNAAVIELPQAIWVSGTKTMDTVLDIPRSELLQDAQLPWFKTIAGTPTAQFEIQGNIYTIAGTAGIALVFEWTCEFQSWNLAAQSPLIALPAIKLPKRVNGEDDERISDAIIVGGVTYRKSAA